MYHDRCDDPERRRARMVSRTELLAVRPDLEPQIDALDAAFSVRITRSFWDRMEGADPQDPLARQVVPDPQELTSHPDDEADPVGDDLRSPLPWVVHKYPSRILLLTTKRCHLYCRYCFRRNHHPTDGLDPTPDEWNAALDYALGKPIHEVILSGGDPLILPDRKLISSLKRLQSIPVRRIHTRAPITFPERITDELVAGLRSVGPVWVVVHCNHPQELSDEVDRALHRLVDGGVPVLNQAVLLRGVNDHVDTLVTLCERLVERRVFPYYLHLTDRVPGNAHLRVSAAEAQALHQALRLRVSGVALPRLVWDPPAGTGKVDVVASAG